MDINIYNIKIKYRSSWEAVFHLLNPKLNYEKIRIPYYLEGLRKLYIVDFEDSDNKILYEIKPNSEINSKKNKIKEIAAKEWAVNNGYAYKIISDEWFLENVHKVDFEKNPQLIKPMKQFFNIEHN